MIGPASQKLETESSWIKTGYSYLLRTTYCVPLIFFEALCSERSYKERVKISLTKRTLFLLMAAPGFQFFFNFGLLFGSDNLIQSHSYVCNTIFCIPVALIGYCRFR